MAEKTPLSPGQRGCGAAFFGLFLVMGLALLLALTSLVLETMRTYFWAKTPCTILVSERITAGPETAKSDGFVIRYRYSVAGREYTSDQFSAGMKESLSSKKIEVLLSRYQKGASAFCYVKQSDPSRAVLQRGNLLVGLMVLFPLIFIGIGAGGVLAALRPKTFASRASSRSRQQIASKFLPGLFFGLFTLVGGMMFYFFTVRPLLLYLDARSWPETPCEIVSSSVGSHRSSGKNSGTTYSIDIVYRYTVAGREYRSDRYQLMDASSSGRQSKAAVIARYPVGSQAMCYVNPKDPTEALLHRKLGLFALIGLLPALFLLIGLGGIFGMIRTALKGSGSVGLPGAPILPAQSGIPTGFGAGPAILTPSASPMAKFIGAVFVALIWNGLCGFFIGMAAQSWDVGLSIVMFFFAVVGLALIGLAFVMFLNLFNPRVALAVNSRSVPLGGTLDLRWSLRGNVSRIHRLRIVLEGREEATYRSGKNNRTDRQVFARLSIADTIDENHMREGHAQLTVPDNLMHTWDGGSNKIVWELQVRGEIARYPDVSEDYTFTILPKQI